MGYRVREEPQGEPGRQHEGNVGTHICAYEARVGAQAGKGWQDLTFPHSQQSPQGLLPPEVI